MDKMESKTRYKYYSKTIPARVDLDKEIQKGLDTNVFSETYQKKGEGLYHGPNYHLSVRNVEGGEREIRIESLGIPMNKTSLQNLLKMRFK